MVNKKKAMNSNKKFIIVSVSLLAVFIGLLSAFGWEKFSKIEDKNHPTIKLCREEVAKRISNIAEMEFWTFSNSDDAYIYEDRYEVVGFMGHMRQRIGNPYPAKFLQADCFERWEEKCLISWSRQYKCQFFYDTNKNITKKTVEIVEIE